MGELKINLVTTLKNEGPFILEWVAHHKAVGFDRIGIAYHDCTDGSDVLLQALDQAGWIEAFPFEVKPKKGPQHSGLAHLHAKDIVQNADWVAVIDVDEFLNIHVGDHSARSLVSMFGDNVDFVCVNWKCFFGDNVENRDASQLVTEIYKEAFQGDRKNQAVKSITRDPKRFRTLHPHNPFRFSLGRPPIYANMSGEIFDYQENRDGKMVFVFNGAKEKKVTHQYAQINHYITKSFPDYLLQRCRGNGFGKDTRYGFGYYNRWINGPTTRDHTIERYSEKTREITQQILQSPSLARIQQEVIAHYNDRLRLANKLIDQHAMNLPDSFEAIIVDLKANMITYDYYNA